MADYKHYKLYILSWYKISYLKISQKETLKNFTSPLGNMSHIIDFVPSLLKFIHPCIESIFHSRTKSIPIPISKIMHLLYKYRKGYRFLAFWLRSSVVSVLISLNTEKFAVYQKPLVNYTYKSQLFKCFNREKPEKRKYWCYLI